MKTDERDERARRRWGASGAKDNERRRPGGGGRGSEKRLRAFVRRSAALAGEVHTHDVV